MVTMALFRKRPEVSLDRHQSTFGIPVLNKGVRVESSPDGAVKLSYTVRRGYGFLDRFRPEEMERQIELDELGSFVVELIDGKHNVLEIVEAFQQKYKTNRRETQMSVVTFLKTLAARGIASVVIP